MLEELENIPLFEGLDSAVLADITTFCKPLELSDGDVLISEHDQQADIFILCNGRVEILSGATPSTSSEVAISEAKKNIFGEVNWLLCNQRTATVRCMDEVSAIRIDGPRLMTYLEEHPNAGFIIMRRIAKLLAGRLKHSDVLLKQILWNSLI